MRRAANRAARNAEDASWLAAPPGKYRCDSFYGNQCCHIYSIICLSVAAWLFSRCDELASLAANPPRAVKVDTYNAVVSNWTGGSAAAYKVKWSGDATRSPMTFPSFSVLMNDGSLDRRFDTAGFRLLTTGDVAYGKLKDVETDYMRYSEGAVLYAELPNFHNPNRDSDDEFQISIDGRIIKLPGFVCRKWNTYRRIYNRNTGCFRATRHFLSGVEVVSNGDGVGVQSMYDGGAVRVDPGCSQLSQLTPRLLSGTFSARN
mmetsp:Transcript_30639/g.76194  ORF Transcript_30639/g.76194 Transcript_30639/m.76194 type:complete len:260 (-) Transcript_30639:1196-1975(-)